MFGRTPSCAWVALVGPVFFALVSATSLADDAEPSSIGVGGFVSGGATTAVGDFDDAYENTDGARLSPAGGAGATINARILDWLAISAGVGVLSQGYKLTWATSGPDVESWTTVFYLRVPLIVLLDFRNGYQLGGGLAFDAGLKGSRLTARDSVAESMDWEPSRWETYRRFNVAALVQANYIVRLGRFCVVPGIEISMHLFNNIVGDDYSGDALEGSERHLNLMLVVGFLSGL